MITYKVLGQSCPATTGTLTPLYTVPANASTVVSSLSVTDVGGNGGAWSLSIAVNGAVDALPQYLYGSQSFGISIDAKDTFIATIGLTLGAGDVIRVCNQSSGASELTFQVFGAENS